MFPYRALIRNIHLNKISPDLEKLKKFIEEYQLGGAEKPPTQRSFSFDDVKAIIEAKSRYAI